jgi:predicted Rdx family selenoprotein
VDLSPPWNHSGQSFEILSAFVPSTAALGGIMVAPVKPWGGERNGAWPAPRLLSRFINDFLGCDRSLIDNHRTQTAIIEHLKN